MSRRSAVAILYELNLNDESIRFVMSQINRYPVSWLAGLIFNVALVFYVYLVVEGGPDSVRHGADWPTILNEIPQMILIVLVAVFLPYLMLWFKCKEKGSTISPPGRLMLVTTVCSALVIISAQATLTMELALDIGWVFLWVIAVYFILIPETRQR